MLNAHIRPLAPSEAPAYVALRREMLADSPWAFSASPEDDVGLDPAFTAARLAEPGQAIVGAVSDTGVLIGAAGLVRNRHIKMAHRARIWGVYVTTTARGQGFATQILSATIDLARTWPGVESVGLSVSENAPTARGLYQRLGFVAWGIEPDTIRFPGRSFAEFHMLLDLQRPQVG